jgi:large subunit ribosomal protein L32e
MRTEEQGWPKSVKVGYRGPTAVRGLHSSGYEEVMIWNIADLANVDPETQVARIGGTVGGRKREGILEKAEELEIRILNPGVEEEEGDFEDLEAEDEFEDLDDEDENEEENEDMEDEEE